MARIERITAILNQALKPELLTIRDDSHRHAGHAGASPEGESHLHITVVSSAFNGLSRVAKHRKVFALLEEELASGLHALSLDAREASM